MSLLKKIRLMILNSKNFFNLSVKSTRGSHKREPFIDFKSLVEFHFQNFSSHNHPCRQTLQIALEHLNQKPSVIVETGSSAWGSNSSLLFDSYVNSFGGVFESVDIRVDPMHRLKKVCSSKSTFFFDDSVSYLRKYLKRSKKIDLLYLDSWDVDWSDPIPSALHGLNEFLTIFPILKKNGGLLLIDDTPKNSNIMQKVSEKHLNDYNLFITQYGFPPGKGSLVKNFLENNSIGSLLAHEYQILWKFA